MELRWCNVGRAQQLVDLATVVDLVLEQVREVPKHVLVHDAARTLQPNLLVQAPRGQTLDGTHQA